MDGREALAEIKADPDLRRIPVVVLKGDLELLMKPVQPLGLLRKEREILDR